MLVLWWIGSESLQNYWKSFLPYLLSAMWRYNRNCQSINRKKYLTRTHVGTYLRLLASQFKFSSVAQIYQTLYNPMDCSTPGSPVHHQLPELAQTHVHRGGDAVQPSHPLSPPTPPEFNLSQHQALFQWVSPLHQVAKVLEFSISASNEHSVLISFRTDWFELPAAQETLRSLLQNHSSKASVHRHSTFFMVSSYTHMWLLEKT